MNESSFPSSVSIVVPTYNRCERLGRVLTALSKQVVDVPVDVVVVDDGSDDETPEYLRSGDLPLAVSVISHANAGPAAARNAGIEHTSGELVLFIDDDVVADEGLVQAHVDTHRRLADQTVVMGPMLSPGDHAMSPWVEWEQAMLVKQYDAMSAGRYGATARQFYTGNASLARVHLDAVGGFDATFRRAEDVELAYRLADRGLAFHFAPDAIGYHYAERSYDAWRAMAGAYGRNDVVFARDLGRDKIFRFIRSGYRRRHPATKLLIRAAVHREAWRDRSSSALEWLVRTLPADRAGRVRRFALSGLYAMDYHCAVADELGSSQAFFELLRSGRAPSAKTS